MRRWQEVVDVLKMCLTPGRLQRQTAATSSSSAANWEVVEVPLTSPVSGHSTKPLNKMVTVLLLRLWEKAGSWSKHSNASPNKSWTLIAVWEQIADVPFLSRSGTSSSSASALKDAEVLFSPKEKCGEFFALKCENAVALEALHLEGLRQSACGRGQGSFGRVLRLSWSTWMCRWRTFWTRTAAASALGVIRSSSASVISTVKSRCLTAWCGSWRLFLATPSWPCAGAQSQVTGPCEPEVVGVLCFTSPPLLHGCHGNWVSPELYMRGFSACLAPHSWSYQVFLRAPRTWCHAESGVSVGEHSGFSGRCLHVLSPCSAHSQEVGGSCCGPLLHLEASLKGAVMFATSACTAVTNHRILRHSDAAAPTFGAWNGRGWCSVNASGKHSAAQSCAGAVH